MATTGATIDILRGDTLSQAFTDIGVLTGYTYLDFTVKRRIETDLDSEAIIQIRKAASGLSDGLLVLNGVTGTAASGSITISDEATGDITIALAATASDELDPAAGLFYDIQRIVGAVVTTLVVGVINVEADTTRAVT
jgi:hypothetical protein